MHQGETSKSIFAKLRGLLFLFSLFLYILMAPTAHAGEAILTWDPPTTNVDGTPLTDLAGYKVYYGTASGSYDVTIDTGNITTYTITGLAERVTYYFAVTAYDTIGNESDFSNEVSKTIPDTTPPSISGVTVTTITSDSAVITWTTDEPSTSQIEYGTTTSYGSSTTIDNTLVTSHSVTLSGLLPQTTYHFRVKSQDEAGNMATSSDVTFTTLTPPDTTPPTGSISINDGAIRTASRTVSLTLSCSDTGTGCNRMQISNDNSNWTAWESYNSTKAWELSSGDGIKTVYVKYQDGAGNISTYTDTITLDTTGPGISNINISDITATEATITWTTDEPSTSSIEYGTSSLYGNLGPVNTTLTTSHSIILSGLSPETTYHFRILAEDEAGNQSNSIEYTFTTDSQPLPDTPAPIGDLRIRPGSCTRDSLVLEWTATGADGSAGTASAYDVRISTYRIIEDGLSPARGEINFSDATQISGVTSPATAGTAESLTITGLETNRVYYFAIKAIDDKGNVSPISNVINSDLVPPQPVTALRNGYTLVSFPLVPWTLDAGELLSSIAGNSVEEIKWWKSYGLGDNNGEWLVDNIAIVPGYGYFIKSSADNVVLNTTGTPITDTSVTVPLQPGWNMIGNPYPVEIYLINTYIRNLDTGELKSYEDAVIAGWVGNAMYSYNGSTYDYIMYTDAILRLWEGYWIAVLKNGNYELVVYRP